MYVCVCVRVCSEEEVVYDNHFMAKKVIRY